MNRVTIILEMTSHSHFEDAMKFALGLRGILNPEISITWQGEPNQPFDEDEDVPF